MAEEKKAGKAGAAKKATDPVEQAVAENREEDTQATGELPQQEAVKDRGEMLRENAVPEVVEQETIVREEAGQDAAAQETPQQESTVQDMMAQEAPVQESAGREAVPSEGMGQQAAVQETVMRQPVPAMSDASGAAPKTEAPPIQQAPYTPPLYAAVPPNMPQGDFQGYYVQAGMPGQPVHSYPQPYQPGYIHGQQGYPYPQPYQPGYVPVQHGPAGNYAPAPHQQPPYGPHPGYGPPQQPHYVPPVAYAPPVYAPQAAPARVKLKGKDKAAGLILVILGALGTLFWAVCFFLALFEAVFESNRGSAEVLLPFILFTGYFVLLLIAGIRCLLAKGKVLAILSPIPAGLLAGLTTFAMIAETNAVPLIVGLWGLCAVVLTATLLRCIPSRTPPEVKLTLL